MNKHSLHQLQAFLIIQRIYIYLFIVKYFQSLYRLVSIEDESGNRVTFIYEGGRLTSIKDSKGETTLTFNVPRIRGDEPAIGITVNDDFFSKLKASERVIIEKIGGHLKVRGIPKGVTIMLLEYRARGILNKI